MKKIAFVVTALGYVISGYLSAVRSTGRVGSTSTIAQGDHIIINVNDKTVVDYVDKKITYTKGYLALQQHNKGSVVMLKNLVIKSWPLINPSRLCAN